MLPGYTIEITGIDELVARFIRGEVQAVIETTRAMNESVDAVRKDAQIYPPETGANQPPPPYYIRGTGTQYQNYNRHESEQLNTKWETEVTIDTEGILGIVKNFKTSYAPWVHSMTRQVSFHALRGWRTVDVIAEQNRQKIIQYFENAARRLAQFLNP